LVGDFRGLTALRKRFVAVLIAAWFLVTPALAEKNDPGKIEIQANEIVRGIIKGVGEGDYEKYIEHFSEAMKKASTREAFLQVQGNIRKKLGKIQSLDYLGSYVQEGNVIALFKARFSKEKDDVLIKVVLEKSKSILKVVGLWFDAPSLLP
jgi:hypothetical protein